MDAEGIRALPEKIAAAEKAPMPQNVEVLSGAAELLPEVSAQFGDCASTTAFPK